jgi:hypothetical protein
MKDYKNFNQKTGMNENGGRTSPIEQNLLYKMHYLVFAPPLILKDANAKDTLHQNFSVSPNEFIRRI